MYYRSLEDMHRAIVNGLPRVPQDVDVIVGIPRSGLIPATLLALHLNLPMTDVDGLIAGRRFTTRFNKGNGQGSDGKGGFRKALVVDDSVAAGIQMQQTRALIEQAGLSDRVTYAAVFAGPGSEKYVDLVFDVCPFPRVFAWNFMHHELLSWACVDLDGVLCRDPSPEENDDGERYAQFLRDVEPRFRPRGTIGHIVTCRLEKYRGATEAWLRSHGVVYGRLVMLDLPTAVARRESQPHAEFKARVYKSTKTRLFVESSYAQAARIAQLAGKPVLCAETMDLIQPGLNARARAIVSGPPPVSLWRARVAAAVFLRFRLRRLWWRISRSGRKVTGGPPETRPTAAGPVGREER